MAYLDNSETPNDSEGAMDGYDDVRATFGDRLTAAWEALGLSPEQLAGRLGVRRAAVLAWEGDRAEPRADRMQMLAGVLNISLVWLLTGEGDGPLAMADPPGVEGLLAEFDALRREQRRLADRFARFESRLRAALNA
ncbi:MAG: multiprotein-bridging factor 1 family protein [Pikeienuella sp.]